MGIQSTRGISRQDAIRRISTIESMMMAGDCRGLEEVTFEPDDDPTLAMIHLRDVGPSFDMCLCTNGMLEDKMDEPYFRFSMFENYFVVEDTP